MTTATVTIRPGSARAWWLALRPATLLASLAPVAVGAAVARAAGGFALGPALAALGGALLLQIACNLANDAADFERGADQDRIGPLRTAQAGLLSPQALRVGVALALAGALGLGLYLAAVAGWAIVVVGLAAMIAALAYTGGPFPLGYHGLGEVCVVAFFGFAAVDGTVFVELGRVPGLALLPAAAMGLCASAILVVNNLRDRVGDSRAGKRTLAVRFGARAARVEYVALLAVAHALAPVAAVVAHRPALLVPLASAPLALARARAVWLRDGGALNPSLGATAQLLLLHGALWTVALLAAAPL